MTGGHGVVTKEVPYRDGTSTLSGVLAWDDQSSAKRPGVLVVHGGAGLDAHARTQAQRFADAGYVAFACDMYGDAVRGNRERVMGEITRLRADRHQVVARATPAIDLLLSQSQCDGRFAIVGYCLGGLVALELARSGVEAAAVVSVHGTLTTTQPVDPGTIRSPLLVLQGGADPHCTLADAFGFASEMKTVGADWEMAIYGNAQHGFTHADAAGQMPGVRYDADADARSLAAIGAFLDRVFGGATVP
jgi:dienelactone hydrolase